MGVLTDTTEGRILARWIADRGLEPYLPPLAFRFLGVMTQLSRYTVVSALALGLDIVIYMALVGWGLMAALAGVVGYSVGMILHYALSCRFVFKREMTAKTETRLFTEFAASGVAGLMLMLTAVMIALAHNVMGLTPFIAKLIAVVVSFSAVFVLRRSVVFSAKSA